MNNKKPHYRVGIGGLGAIGMKIAQALDAGIPGLALAAVSARDQLAATRRLVAFVNVPPVVPLEALAEHADVVVECAPAAVFDAVAIPAVEASRIFMPLSCAALLSRAGLVERAEETGGRIIVPTGALVGLDAVRAAAELDGIRSVSMTSVKPPRTLKHSPFLIAKGIDVNSFERSTKIFEGSARQAAEGFPANVNIVAALSLAGIGPDATQVAIWVNPNAERNVHTVEVDATSTRFSMTIEGIPSAENPSSGLLPPLSAIAALRALTGTFRVGS